MDKLCSNPDCNVEEDGLCIEGFEPIETCTYYNAEVSNQTKTILSDTKESADNVDENIAIDFAEVSTGDMLGCEEANEILRCNGARVIACAGPSDIGKTTFFASIYELLSEQPIGEFSFAGSETLFNFEKICHFARMESRGHKPETERTRRQGTAKFHHLVLKSTTLERFDLLFADRAGEEYDAACNSGDDCRKLFEIPRSDTLLLLIDAFTLGHQTKRHLARRQTENLVQALLTESMLKRTTRIILVMTRFDLVMQNGTSEQAKSEQTKVLSKIKKILQELDIQVDAHIIAARPDKPDVLEMGYGICDLLRKITKPILVSKEKRVPVKGSRSFQKLRI
jgi:hypothetical protein